MPWKIEQRDDEYCVIKEADGEVEGCHETRDKALAQLAALNAAEEKEGGETENTKYGLGLGGLPRLMLDEQAGECLGGPTTFAELDAAQEALDKSASMQLLAGQFQTLVSNVMTSDIEDKGAAVEALASELSQRMSAVKAIQPRWQPLTDRAANFLAGVTKQTPMKTEDGVKYPASDYAYVPDVEKPSTWKLRMSEGQPGNITKAQLGRAAAAFSPGGFRGQKVEIPGGDVASVKAKIRAAYRKLGVEDADIPPALKEKSLMVYKSGDTYRWAAIYSNNYRDRDNPPEIISQEAHKSFVRAVDAGEWPMPELLWWHVKGKPLGVADLVFWDERTNCAWASGSFSSREIAEGIAASKERLGVSHGMPVEHIRRDESDPSIITDYRSVEISFLPARVAANELTGVYSKEKDMNDEQKLAELAQATGVDPATLGAEKKAEAEKRKLDSKEVDGEAPPATEAPPAPAPVTAEDVAAVVQAVMTPVIARLEALEGAEKARKEAPPTPGENILSLLKDASIIGKKEAQVDGRKARHEGPAETSVDQPVQDGSFFGSVMGPILDGSFQKNMNDKLGVQ
jgi:hypothetical protein